MGSEMCIRDSPPVGSRHHIRRSPRSTAPHPPQSAKQDRVRGQYDRRRNDEAEDKLERRPDAGQSSRPGQLAGGGFTRRGRVADSGVGEIRCGDGGTRGPDDADGDLTYADCTKTGEAVVAGQTPVDAEQRQGEDAGELADVSYDVRHLARHLTEHSSERPTVTVRKRTTTKNE